MFLLFFISIFLFLVGAYGLFLSRKSIIILLISLELILLSLDLNFIVFSVYLDDLLGQIYTLLILTVTAAESAIGLAITICFYRLRGGISVDFIKLLKG